MHIEFDYRRLKLNFIRFICESNEVERDEQILIYAQKTNNAKKHRSYLRPDMNFSH